jgi:putative ABC transport system permease protein
MRNVRYALRLLSKSPGFTLVAVLTLALGIGMNSAIFTIIDAVMLRPLSYSEPRRLVSIWERLTGPEPSNWNTSNSGPDPRNHMTVSAANFVDFTKSIRSAELASYQGVAMNLTDSGPPDRIAGERVSANYFRVLGVEPAQGRGFLADEDRDGAEPVVIISHDFWERRLGLDSNWSAKSLVLGGQKYRIVGVLPHGFQSPNELLDIDHASFFIPAAYPAAMTSDHSTHQIWALARLAPGATVQRLQSELDAVSARLSQQFPDTNKNIKTVVAPLESDVVRNARTSLLVMLGAVGLVLLIACANLANLLLARAVSRQKEISIRFALGASRGRVIGELLSQSLALAALGAIGGLALGVWTRMLLVKFAPEGIPRIASASLDPSVFLFTLLLSLVTGIAFGLFPALQVSKSGPAESLKSNERSMAGAGVMRWRSALMIAEISVSMILLVGAGLLVRSFILLNRVDLGFDTEHVVAMRVVLPDLRYGLEDRRLLFFENLESRVAALPGVQSVAFANRMPMRGGWDSSLVLDDGTQPDCDAQVVSPGYFQTIGVGLQRGRLFTPADRNGTPLVAIVNHQFVRAYLHDQDPIGRRLRFGSQFPWVTIVGAVNDIRRGGKKADLLPEIYFPAAKGKVWPVTLSDLAFRAAGDPKRLVAAVQQQVWAIDKDQPLTQVRTLDEIVSESVATRRFQTLLLAAFAALALGLALVGVYGVISYGVSQRTREIGLRIALGAQRGDILRVVIVRAMLVALGGIATGTVGAYGFSRSLSTLLFEIKPTDPVTYGTIAALLMIVALAACYIPARRATKVDPMVALRYE